MAYRKLPNHYNEITQQVIGAAIEVHQQLGPGFLERTYEAALSVELDLRGIAHERQYPVALTYKGHPVGEGRVDLFVEDSLVVELKTVDHLSPTNHAQVIAYLKALKQPLGLLINFNVAVLSKGVRRVILSKQK